MIRYVFTVLSALFSLYSVVIFIRIILSWFSGAGTSRTQSYLCRITDPYISLFRGFRILRVLDIDLAPLFSMLVLSVISSSLLRIAQTGTISVGFLLSLLLSMLGGLASFLVGFYLILMILRLVAYLVKADIYAPFWRLIDYLSRPIHYQITRIFFRNSIGHYLTGIILTIVSLVLLFVCINVFVRIGESVLRSLPY